VAKLLSTVWSAMEDEGLLKCAEVGDGRYGCVGVGRRGAARDHRAREGGGGRRADHPTRPHNRSLGGLCIHKP